MNWIREEVVVTHLTSHKLKVDNVSKALKGVWGVCVCIELGLRMRDEMVWCLVVGELVELLVVEQLSKAEIGVQRMSDGDEGWWWMCVWAHMSLRDEDEFVCELSMRWGRRISYVVCGGWGCERWGRWLEVGGGWGVSLGCDYHREVSKLVKERESVVECEVLL